MGFPEIVAELLGRASFLVARVASEALPLRTV